MTLSNGIGNEEAKPKASNWEVSKSVYKEEMASPSVEDRVIEVANKQRRSTEGASNKLKMKSLVSHLSVNDSYQRLHIHPSAAIGYYNTDRNVSAMDKYQQHVIFLNNYRFYLNGIGDDLIRGQYNHLFFWRC